MRTTPLDHPGPERPHRVYVALTNHCNRSCPWCSTCSSPKGGTWLSLEDYERSFPESGVFEVQLEGGEPTIHPRFDDFVRIAREHPRCSRLVVCTNGVVLPREPSGLRAWTEGLGAPLTIKLSLNHHLIERDVGLVALARLLREVISDAGGDRLLVLNVRLRRGTADDDRWVVDAVRDAGLLEWANVFYLQRYGFAEKQSDWERPFIVGRDFRMVNPDGRVFGPELIARSEAMRILR
jgi:MoaA/NifB/PqqE/SkfB family radical SAM enzyme